MVLRAQSTTKDYIKAEHKLQYISTLFIPQVFTTQIKNAGEEDSWPNNRYKEFSLVLSSNTELTWAVIYFFVTHIYTFSFIRYLDLVVLRITLYPVNNK